MIVIGLTQDAIKKPVRMHQVIKIQNYYANNGYLFVQVKIQINVKQSHAKIDYHFSSDVECR